jgi:exodeoxyribonuclease VII large subunit
MSTRPTRHSSRVPPDGYPADVTLETSPEQPAPVRTVSRLLLEWIGRLGAIWIEGQLAEVRPRPGAPQVFCVLRDTDANVSLSLVLSSGLLDSITPPITEGQRVIVHAKPEFWTGRGALQLRAREIRSVGVGALLEQLERLRLTLAAEGLFDPARKKAPPFLPGCIGLICGRAAAAMDDVLVNARLRWPGVRFEVREVAVQGVNAVSEVSAALAELDALPQVDVIVIARGGGSFEDLLPFSNEALIRAVAACATPVVSAIGHEQDAPLLDHVADLRASTPTDAAKRLVPDVGEEFALIDRAEAALRRGAHTRITAESRAVSDAVGRVRRDVHARLDRARADVEHLAAQVRALSPAATLERGYAVVQYDGHVVLDPGVVPDDAHLRIRVARGSLNAIRTPDEPDGGPSGR